MDKIPTTDFSTWMSSYGLLTAEQILGRFDIHLPIETLSSVLKKSEGVYYPLVKIPLKNIFNGIILQQAHDYQVFAQKLFIDYFLSGASDKDNTMPGADSRKDLEVEYNKLVQMSADFSKQEYEHKKLIADSQGYLIPLSAGFKGPTPVGISPEAQTIIDEYMTRADEITIILRDFRKQFYDLIVRAETIIQLLPEYSLDEEKDAINRELLHFDQHFGDEEEKA